MRRDKRILCLQSWSLHRNYPPSREMLLSIKHKGLSLLKHQLQVNLHVRAAGVCCVGWWIERWMKHKSWFYQGSCPPRTLPLQTKQTEPWFPPADGTCCGFSRRRGFIRAFGCDGMLCFYVICAGYRDPRPQFSRTLWDLEVVQLCFFGACPWA